MVLDETNKAVVVDVHDCRPLGFYRKRVSIFKLSGNEVYCTNALLLLRGNVVVFTITSKDHAA